MADLHPDRLPDAENAIIPDAKLRDYLLNPKHSLEAAAKARWLALFGYTEDNWDELRDVILERIPLEPGYRRTESKYGDRWQAFIPIEGNGRRAVMLTAWVKDGGTPPRFVTAYPADRHRANPAE